MARYSPILTDHYDRLEDAIEISVGKSAMAKAFASEVAVTAVAVENPPIYGTDAADSLVGTDGHDNLYGLGGADTIRGGNGNDHIYGHSSTGGADDGNDFIDGGAGADYIQGNAGDDTLLGGNGNDRINGGQGADSINGGGGNDVINGNRGDDIIYGGDENDTDSDFIRGGQGNDTLYGGGGDDTLSGDLGRDVLNGGAGADVFVLSVPASAADGFFDRIIDFQNGVDHLQLPYKPTTVLYSIEQKDFNAAYSEAKLLLGHNPGTEDAAALQVGSDTYLFFADVPGSFEYGVVLLYHENASNIDISDFI